jgi:hypothetical protein
MVHTITNAIVHMRWNRDRFIDSLQPSRTSSASVYTIYEYGLGSSHTTCIGPSESYQGIDTSKTTFRLGGGNMTIACDQSGKRLMRKLVEVGAISWRFISN